MRLRVHVAVDDLGKPVVAIAAWAVCAVATASCSPDSGAATAAMITANPGAVCASPETMDGLRRVALSNIDLSGYAPEVNPAYRDRLAAQTVVSIDAPVMDKFDRTTRSVSCTGVLTFKWPNAILSKLKRAQGNLDWSPYSAPATYVIQPGSASNGVSYSLDSRFRGGLMAVLKPMLQTLADADAANAAAKYNAAIGID